ncbi:MAG: M24 family metallopeptidase, partial [Actinomycetia bacterium]|nr:M24 family metallopeptidase [Actinomycetes bacterium]
KFRKIYDIVLQAKKLAIENCKEGIKGKDLDNIARRFITSNGFGENYRHGLGHGVGLEVHEAPIVSTDQENVLKENMVITIEPGIYIPGLGGIRIEDMVIVKKNGCEILYKSKKDFTILP